MNVQARIDELSQQLETLKAEVAARPPVKNGMDRRSLLRRGGAVVAGAAGGAVLLSNGTAHAAAGGNFILGQPNDAETAVTSLTSSTTGSTLSLGNSNVDSSTSHSPLSLSPRSEAPTGIVGAGALFAHTTATRTELKFSHRSFTIKPFTGAQIGTLLSTVNANFLRILPTPVRVIDTRNGFGVAAAGKRAANTKTTINVTPAGTGALAVIGVVTAVDPDEVGYFTLYRSDPLPQIRSASYQPNQDFSGLALVSLNADTFIAYTSKRTHIVFDVVALVVNTT